MLPVLVVAIGGLLLAFALTFGVMPKIITLMHSRNIVGIDVHKLDKPAVAEMGGLGLLFGVTGGCLLLFFGTGFLGFGFLDYRILIFLAVVLLAGLIGAIDDLKTLGPRIKPLLTAVASLPIFLAHFVVSGLGLSSILPLPYNPRPNLPILGRARLTIIYPLLIPFAIAVPANAVNMLDVFNGVMPITTILMFTAMLIVSLILMAAGIPDAWLGVLLSSVMLGALAAYYYFNRYPARIFAGDTGSLSVGAAIGALAVIGQIEIVALVALLPAVMNAFYSIISIGGLLERRQMKGRPTIFQEDGTLAATRDRDAPLTLTRLVLARGPLTEQKITFSLAVLTLTSSILAITTVLLIPYVTVGYLIFWPLNLLVVWVIPLGLLFLIYIRLRNKDHLGIRLAGLIGIMIGVWTGGMVGFAALDFLVELQPPPGLELDFAILRPLTGIAVVLGWLALWHIATRLYFRYELRRSTATTGGEPKI